MQRKPMSEAMGCILNCTLILGFLISATAAASEAWCDPEELGKGFRKIVDESSAGKRIRFSSIARARHAGRIMDALGFHNSGINRPRMKTFLKTAYAESRNDSEFAHIAETISDVAHDGKSTPVEKVFRPGRSPTQATGSSACCEEGRLIVNLGNVNRGGELTGSRPDPRDVERTFVRYLASVVDGLVEAVDAGSVQIVQLNFKQVTNARLLNRLKRMGATPVSWDGMDGTTLTEGLSLPDEFLAWFKNPDAGEKEAQEMLNILESRFPRFNWKLEWSLQPASKQ